MSSESQFREGRGLPSDGEGHASSPGGMRHSGGMSGRGIPALLDWIDAAEAVNRAPAVRLLTAVLVLVLGLLLAIRVGWLPS